LGAFKVHWPAKNTSGPPKAENLAYGGNHWQENAIGAPGDDETVTKRFWNVSDACLTRARRVPDA
jgi:hypothetical protein